LIFFVKSCCLRSQAILSSHLLHSDLLLLVVDRIDRQPFFILITKNCLLLLEVPFQFASASKQKDRDAHRKTLVEVVSVGYKVPPCK